MPTYTKVVTLTPVELLKQSRDLISDPSHWCQRILERTHLAEDGQLVHEYCAAGALNYITVQSGTPLLVLKYASMMLTQASVKLYGHGYIAVNDNLGHDAILKCFDLAIQES